MSVTASDNAFAMARHRSSAVPLAWAVGALIFYASLYPFNSWQVPGVPWFSFLELTWPRYWTAFDLVSNLLGYVPLGLLIYIASVRSGWRSGWGWLLALALGSLLSLSLELLQQMLPRRVPSNLDWVLNSVGAGLGASVGAVVQWRGGGRRWQSVRDRWFVGRSAGGLALLLLWPVGLLFPLPLPLGVGQIMGQIQGTVVAWLQGSPVSAWLPAPADAEPLAVVITPSIEFTAIVLGLLAPSLLAFAISHPGWRRSLLALGAAALGFLTTTLSTALNFAPQHAMAWVTPVAGAALAAALCVALLLCWLPRRAVAALGLMTLVALVALVGQAPADPYFAESLQSWEQGRFIRFHGAAQWVGWLWPYAAMAYLFVQVVSRHDD